jgi:exosortase A-associated hydrolase 1
VKTTEQVLTWCCGADRLLGILCTPGPDATGAATDLGVVIVVGGPQYRAGSHRQFTLLARELAAAGTPVLRFDYRGMGDSEGDARSFEQVGDDIASAIHALQVQAPQVRRIVLWGLCDGASAALLYAQATRDARLAGLCLLNPWVRSAQSLAKAHVKHYYLQRLGQRDFWLKLLRGRVALRATLDLARDVKQAARATQPDPAQAPSFQQRMLSGWQAFNGATLVVLSGDDITAQEWTQHTRDDPRWNQTPTSALVTRLEVPHADHTFSSTAAHRRMTDCTLNWLTELAAMTSLATSTMPRVNSTEVAP